MTTLVCGSHSSFAAPSFTPAAANPIIAVLNQRTTRIRVYHVTSSSPGQSSPQQPRMSLAGGEWKRETNQTAGLWFVTDKDSINILPLSIVDACYYVTGTRDQLIVVQ